MSGGNQFSNFPGGFTNGLIVRGMPLLQSQPGRVYWLYNGTTLQTGEVGGSDGNRGTFDRPFNSLNYAVSKCSANRGDIIFVKPGHVEKISTATACLLNIAGVAIIGLGSGSNRPKFTVDTANTATFPVSADNISIQNCQFVANFLGIAACFTLTTAKNFSVTGCTFTDTSSVLNFLNIVKSTGAANTVDGLTFSQNQVINLGVTSNNTTILSANDIDRLTCVGNYLNWAIQNNKAVLAIITAGTLTSCLVDSNVAIRLNTTVVGGFLLNIAAGSGTGMVSNNLMYTAGGTDLVATASSGLCYFNNYYSAAADASGYLLPAADV